MFQQDPVVCEKPLCTSVEPVRRLSRCCIGQQHLEEVSVFVKRAAHTHITGAVSAKSLTSHLGCRANLVRCVNIPLQPSSAFAWIRLSSIRRRANELKSGSGPIISYCNWIFLFSPLWKQCLCNRQQLMHHWKRLITLEEIDGELVTNRLTMTKVKAVTLTRETRR